ncbi:hypothetical protein HpCK38_17240 [Helicobacter pylori]
MIELIDVKKNYPNGFCALKDITLKINENEIMGIIGYSGAGKSTLVRLINRLEEPSGGRILIDGENILELDKTTLRKRRRKIGMIFQHFNLLSAKNVYENIAFALKIAHWDKKIIPHRVEELLELVGLCDKARSYPSQLSGGQKQRVEIARALANEPKILLCDEATSALDTKTTRSILDLLKQIQKKMSLTIVLITHQIEVVSQIADKICVMSEGRIVEVGDKEKILLSPSHKVTQEILLEGGRNLRCEGLSLQSLEKLREEGKIELWMRLKNEDIPSKFQTFRGGNQC